MDELGCLPHSRFWHVNRGFWAPAVAHQVSATLVRYLGGADPGKPRTNDPPCGASRNASVHDDLNSFRSPQHTCSFFIAVIDTNSPTLMIIIFEIHFWRLNIIHETDLLFCSFGGMF